MTVPVGAWDAYVEKLSKINKKAAQLMQAYIDANGADDLNGIIQYAYALTTKYGEAAAALACEMYDEIVVADSFFAPSAIPAATASVSEVANAIEAAAGIAPEQIAQIVGRFVKRTAADTTLQNGLRDGAEFAWIPHGDTCAFCIILASRGWRRVSKDTLKNGHAEHIHNNCDCEYAIRFDSDTQYASYDYKKYEDIYYGASTEGAGEKYIGADGKVHVRKDWQARRNAIQREQYWSNRDEILKKKREKYEEEKNEE